MERGVFVNTGTISRFILRRDRLAMIIWLLAISSVTWMTAIAFKGLYHSEQERQAIAETMRNPAMSAMTGRGYGLDDYTIGAMMAHQMLLFTALAVAIMSILLVNRHTRSEEEEGRYELLRALPTGRLSSISATLLLNGCLNILIALVTGFGLYFMQIESIDFAGSMLYGAVLGATGIFFGSVTAVFAQLSESSRGTIGYSFTLLGISYLIRAVGDSGNETISWFSPLGWVLGAQVYVNNYWWPIALTLAIGLIIATLALYLNAIRDVGAGFIPTKAGRSEASRFLSSPIGLAFRLQRTALYSWTVGMFVLGLSYGSVMGDLESFFADNEVLAEVLQPVEGFTLIEQFIPMLMSVIAMLSTIPVLMVLLKVRGEEKKGRLDHLLSNAVSRNRIVGGYIILAIVTSVVMLFMGVAGLWIAASAVVDDNFGFAMLVKAAFVYLPAIGVMIGIGVFLIGYFPKWTNLVWYYLIYSFFIVYMEGLLQFQDWFGKLSPFGHIPSVPVEEISVVTLSIVIMVGIVLGVMGMKQFRSRDIQ